MSESASPPTRDIETPADVEQLVRAFYGRALSDPVIGWIFTDVAQLDLDEHVPRIASFWETILLGTGTYLGAPFPPHAALHAKVGLKAGHFGRWLALWTTTIDERFAGERAELAKARAIRIAQAFHQRLQALPGPEQPNGAPADGLTVTLHGER
jgi:hemoglobin